MLQTMDTRSRQGYQRLFVRHRQSEILVYLWRERDSKMNIYVGNIAYQLSEDELRSAFEAYGQVESARIVTDRDTGRSKGFGFVEMTNADEAQKAINEMNGKELQDRELIVNEARPREPRNDSRGDSRNNHRRSNGGGYNNRRSRY